MAALDRVQSLEEKVIALADKIIVEELAYGAMVREDAPSWQLSEAREHLRDLACELRSLQDVRDDALGSTAIGVMYVNRAA